MQLPARFDRFNPYPNAICVDWGDDVKLAHIHLPAVQQNWTTVDKRR